MIPVFDEDHGKHWLHTIADWPRPDVIHISAHGTTNGLQHFATGRYGPASQFIGVVSLPLLG